MDLKVINAMTSFENKKGCHKDLCGKHREKKGEWKTATKCREIKKLFFSVTVKLHLDLAVPRL